MTGIFEICADGKAAKAPSNFSTLVDGSECEASTPDMPQSSITHSTKDVLDGTRSKPDGLMMGARMDKGYDSDGGLAEGEEGEQERRAPWANADVDGADLICVPRTVFDEAVIATQAQQLKERITFLGNVPVSSNSALYVCCLCCHGEPGTALCEGLYVCDLAMMCTLGPKACLSGVDLA